MIWRILVFMLLAHAAWAQQISGGAGGGSSSIISGTTPCTGCASGGVLFNNGGVVTGDSGLTKVAGSTGLVTIGAPSSSGSLAVSTTVNTYYMTGGIYRGGDLSISTAASGNGEAVRVATNDTTAGLYLATNLSFGWGTNSTGGSGMGSTYDTLICRTSAGVVAIASANSCATPGALTASGYSAAGSAGVSCTVGTLNPTTAIVVGGIVTHC
jgi:hypothetical protein